MTTLPRSAPLSAFAADAGFEVVRDGRFSNLGLLGTDHPDALVALYSADHVDLVTENPNIKAVLTSPDLATRAPQHAALALASDPLAAFLRLHVRLHEHGFYCNVFASSPEEVAHKLDVLRGHCETEQRDFDTIAKTMMMSSSTDDPDAFLADLVPYRDLGIDTVYTATRGDPVAYAEGFATQLAPRLADL